MARVSLLLVVLTIAMVAPCQGFLKKLLFDEVKTALLEEGNIEIVQQNCNFRVTPRLRSWELRFRGDVWCPGWTAIKGESFTASRTRVVNKAVEDFAKKALAAGLITQEEADPLFNAK